MNDRERITRLEIRCEQLQLTVNEAFHWIDILKSDLSDLQDRVGQADRKTESSSEFPNNCEHITEDGVTCAKYPACDDCLDNPLNKVKGSERLVKGSEQTEPTGYNLSPVDKDINVRSKDETQTEMTTEQVVNELLSIKKILDDGKMPKQRCGNCKHLTYRWNKTWCDIKCDNPHDMVCDKWERSE